MTAERWNEGDQITAQHLNDMIQDTENVATSVETINNTTIPNIRSAVSDAVTNANKVNGFESRVSTLENWKTSKETIYNTAVNNAQSAIDAIDAAKSPNDTLLGKLNSMISNANSTAETKANQALNEAKAYTDQEAAKKANQTSLDATNTNVSDISTALGNLTQLKGGKTNLVTRLADMDSDITNVGLETDRKIAERTVTITALNEVKERLDRVDGGRVDTTSTVVDNHAVRLGNLEKEIINDPTAGSSNIKSNVAALLTEVNNAHRAVQSGQTADTLKSRFEDIEERLDSLDGGETGSESDSLVNIVAAIRSELNAAHRAVEEGQPADTIAARFTSIEDNITSIATELGMLNAGVIEDTNSRIDNIVDTLDTLSSSNDSLTTRVTTIEEDLNTENVGLKARVSELETKDTIIMTVSDFEALDLTSSDINTNADYVIGPDSKGKYVYYKLIEVDGTLQRVMIGGAGQEPIVLESINLLPNVEDAEENIDYYVKNNDDTYTHYRLNGDTWLKVGGGTSAQVVTVLPAATGNSNIDYYYQENNGTYSHYRYINGHLEQISGGANIDLTQYYTKNEISSLLSPINTRIDSLDSDDKRYYAEYGTVTINGEEQENMFVLYEYDKTDENREHMQIVNSFKIVGGGQAQASSLQVKINTKSPVICTRDDDVLIEIEYSSEDTESGATYDGTYTWREGTRVLESGDIVQGTKIFDLTKYYNTLSAVGTHKVTLTISDSAGNVKTNTWNIQIVDIRLESTFNDSYPYPIGRPVSFTYTPYGALSKTLHVKLDGEDLEPVTIPSGISGISQSYSLPAQAHGAHLLECYLTASVGNKNIETPHIYKDIIWFDSTSTIPVISCIYRSDYYGKMEMQQYTTKSIPYTVYSSTSNNPTIVLKEDGKTVNTLRLQTEENIWGYKTDVVAEHDLSITCGETTVEIIADVKKLKYDIAPITTNLAFDFNPSGYSNRDEATRLWTQTNEAGQNLHLTVSNNFDWNTGGYQIDSNGIPYFCVKTGTRAYIDYNLFGTNPKEFGAEFKCIFKSVNVRTITANFLKSKLDNDNVGLLMNAHEAILNTANKSLSIPYSEEDIIEFEYNINPIDTKDELASSYIMTYEDGVGARPLLYDNNDRLYQNSTEKSIIEIGSDDCDVYIYRMKAYTQSLSDRDILNNFYADAPSAEEMINRYERNQIYNENNALTPESVAAACPDLKVIMIDAPYFTNDKKDYVKGTNVQCIHTNGRDRDNWYWENGFHVGQGTSSNRYGAAGRNIDLIFGFDGEHTVVSKIKENTVQGYVSKITFADGSVLTGADAKMNLSGTSIENNWFNIKVNIASSENANNALLQKRYNDYLPYTTPAKRRDSRAKNSMEFYNCVVFIRESDTTQNSEGIYTAHREFPLDTDWHFYGIGNIGDSKKTDNTRVNDPTDIKEFCVEVSDNNLPNSMFQTGVYKLNDGSITFDPTGMSDAEKMERMVYPITEEQWNDERNLARKAISLDGYISGQKLNEETGEMEDVITNWDSSFEFRYDMGTKDGESFPGLEEQQDLSKQVWIDMYKWVITSSDAEFQSHLSDWFIQESPLYWYLFTERYIMIDNRAKNSFYHYGKFYISEAEAEEMGDEAQYYTIDDAAAAIHNGYRFELWNYDDDTALGIDNSGVLKIPYGKEDIDKDSNGAYIYNAAENIFWRRIRKLMGSQLTTLYDSPDLTSCWSANNLINEFDRWQTQFPEELWRLDIERKYIRPYKTGSWDPTNQVYKIDKTFLEGMANGRKRYQRRQFERDQEIYVATKYLQSAIFSDSIEMRLATADPESVQVVPVNDTIKITPYSDMYIRVMFGNTDVVSYRALAGTEYEVSPPFEITSRNTLQITVYAASRIQAFSDLSAFYIRDNNFSRATKLKTLVLGNPTPGYKNTAIESLGIGNNPLLEKLDIRNCPNLAGSLTLSNCQNLTELYATNTAVTSVSFPVGGKIETAYLPATITNLTFRSIKKLTNLNIESYDNLETLLVDDSEIVDPRALIAAARNSLKSVTLSNIFWTAAEDGELTNTDLLEFLSSLYVEEDGNIIKNSIISGEIEIIPASGKIETSTINKYEDFWPDLTLIISDENIQKQLHVLFINAIPTASENNIQDISYELLLDDILYETYINATPNESVKIFGRDAIENDPATDIGFVLPTYQDVKYNYTFGNQSTGVYTPFSGWYNTFTERALNYDSDSYTWTEENQEIIYRAIYQAAPREYNVNWYGASDTTPIASAKVRYGRAAVFPTNIEQPKIKTEGGRYAVFLGWDKNTNKITTDVNVYAKWSNLSTDRSTLANQVSSTGTLTGLSIQDLYAYAQIAKNGAINSTICNNLLVDSQFNMYMGHDLSFDNVEEQTIFNIENPRYFKYGGVGSEARYPYNSEDLEIQPFKDNKPFTLAIDFKFDCLNNNNTLVSCFNRPDQNTGQGFQLLYNTTANTPIVTWGINSPSNSWNSNDPTINTSNNAVKVGHAYSNTHSRNIVVLRYPADGTGKLYVYYDYDESSAANTYSDQPIKEFGLEWPAAQEAITNSDFANTTLKFGYAYQSGNNYSGSSGGTIYWAKIWYDDLGADNCKKIAAWPREKLVMQLSGIYNESGRYITLPSENDKFKENGHANLQFTALNLLEGKGHNISNSALGWEDNILNTFLSTKFYNGIPNDWRSVIINTLLPGSKVTVEAGTGYNNNKISVEEYSTNAYIYIPALGEQIGTHNSTYNEQNLIINNESKQVITKTIYRIISTTGTLDSSIHIEDSQIKFKNFIVPDDAAYYAIPDTSINAGTATINPFDPENPNAIHKGDVWLREVYKSASYPDYIETLPEAYIFVDINDINMYHPFISYECKDANDNLIGGWVKSYAWPVRTIKVNSQEGLGRGALGLDERGYPMHELSRSISFANGICIGFSL